MQRFSRAAVNPQLALRWLLFGVAYLALAELGRFVSFPESAITVFWPASGVYLAVLAMSPVRHWAGYIIAAIAANLFSDWLHETPPIVMAASCAGVTLEAALGARLLQWSYRQPFHIFTLTDVLWLSGVGTLVAPFFAGVIVGTMQAGAVGSASLWRGIGTWWLTHSVGVLVAAPILLTVRSQLAWRRPCGWRVWLEAALAGALIVVSSWIAFGPRLTGPRDIPSYPFVVAPFLVWCGLRFGQFGTALGVFLAAVVSVWGTTRGYGLFAHMEETLAMTSAALQVFLIVLSITPLLFATVIQQQRVAEDRLKQNVDFLQAVMNGTSDAIFVKDLQGRYLLINESGARMLGTTVEGVIGRDDFAFFDEATAKQNQLEDHRTLSSSETRTYEARATRAGAEEAQYYHVTKGPYRDALGRLVGVVGIAIDITDRRRTQEQLERSKAELEQRVTARTAELLKANQRLRLEMNERSKAEGRLREQQTQLAHAARLSSLGQMAAEMAHELNQPLSAISNYVRGTQRRAQAGAVRLEEVLTTLEIVGKEANRAADVVRRTKSFVRKQSPSRTPLDLGAVTHEALVLVQHELREHQVKLQIQLDQPLAPCAGDFVQLQQVIVNLVLNAIDALESLPAEERRIQIALNAQSDFLELSIADNGPGVSPPVAERIFDAFFSTKPEGLGLGLPISRGIIENHGGRLWAERLSDGGTCLRFTIPVWEGMDDNLNGDGTDGFRGR